MRIEKRIVILSVIAVILILCGIGYSSSRSSERELAQLRIHQREFYSLVKEYQAIKSRVNAVEGKQSLTKVRSIVQAMDEIVTPLGIKGKLKEIKPTSAKKGNANVEDEAEVLLEKLDLNEAVNLFYRVDNAPMILSIKRVAMKTAFDNPAQLTVTMTIALVNPK